jgi:hypothetical protein
MGKLAMYGALGGIGKGLNIEAEREFKTEELAARDAREFQMERQRQKSLMERQNVADKAASKREKDRYGPGGYAEVAATHVAEIASTAATSDQAHEIKLQEMKAKAEAAMQTQKSIEMDDQYEYDSTDASQTWDPATNQTTFVEAKRTVTDKITNATYTQVGLAFIPEGLEPPSPTVIKQAMSTLGKWLLDTEDRDVARMRSIKFQRLYGFLPIEYFAKYAGRGPVKKITTRGSASTSTPAVQ